MKLSTIINQIYRWENWGRAVDCALQFQDAIHID